jgi:N-acyl-D-amino-acid deacylase
MRRRPASPIPSRAARGAATLLAVLAAAATVAAAGTGLGAQQPPQAGPGQPQHFDVLIRGGHVMDGTGNPSFRADVGVRGDRIAAIGRLDGATAERVIDATGRIVTPGFIDIHSHADDGSGGRRTLRNEDPRVRAAPNLVTQGITTVVVNQDGRSPWPIAEQRATLERLGVGVNTILLVGHGEVRRRVMGSDHQRPATEDEVRRMRALVRQAMQEGAWGLSAGLEYVPGRWSTTDEVVALVEEIVPFGGVYISHQRSEGSDPMWYWPSQDGAGPPTLLDAVRETIEIGERTGATVVASHIKAKGAHYWGSGAAAIQLIEAARARGVQIYADQYPYETSGTDGSTVLIPGWALAPRPAAAAAGAAQTGGAQQAAGQTAAAGAAATSLADRLRAVMADPELNADLRRDITHEIARRGGAAKVLILDHPRPDYVGKTLAEIAADMRLGEIDAAIQLQLGGYPDRRGGARVRGFSLSELDMDMYARLPWVATATDGGIALLDDGAGTHARFYGTFPRKIRHFALDRGVITLEDAVRSSTSLPAQILGLKNRGVLREGAFADIVVFDLDTIRDRSTFFEPHQYSEGVEHVLINGRAAVENGALVWSHAGRIIVW